MTTYFLLHILYFITIVKLNSHITHSSKILKIGRNSYFLLKKVEEKQEKRTILTLTVLVLNLFVNYNTYCFNPFGKFYLNTLNKILTNSTYCPPERHK